MKQLVIISLVLLLSLTLHAQEDEQINEAEILWDTWGVPHIFAPDNEALFYAFGWAQAHTHGNLILKLYGDARGRAAEYWGDSFADDDEWVHLLDIAGQAEAAYADLSDEGRLYVDAFAAGFNAYAESHLDEIADNRKMVLPVQPVDVVAHGIRTLKYLFFARDWESAANIWQRDVGEAGLPDDGTYIVGAQHDAPPHDEIPGSNGWAIAPSNSASGKAMLVVNPHQPWRDWGLWVEAHLNAPGVNLYGAALLGSPAIGVGFNPYLGWTHTVNTHDGWDVYELTLTDDGGYLFDGENREFEVREASYKVLQDDGTLQEITLTVQSSVHGPVVRRSDADGKALALRVANPPGNGYGAFEQWWQMGTATNFEEFQAAFDPIRIPMFNVIYADRDGNIMGLHNELIPVRQSGDWSFWNNTSIINNNNPAVIPGDTSDYLWTEYHTYEDLPKVINPPSGWVQNANEPPWTLTLPPPFTPDDFPAYMLPEPFVWARPLTSLRMLSEDDSITYDELLEYKNSTFVELTNGTLEELIAVARQSDAAVVQRAADVLEAWDGYTETDSEGAVLYILWAAEYFGSRLTGGFETQWDISDPLNPPRGLADPESAVAALESAARQLQVIGLLRGGMTIPYGEVFRLRWRGGIDLPASGTSDLLGSFRILTFVQDDDQRFYPVHGDSFIALVEFDEPIRAQVLLAYGNSSQPRSPHNGDQFALFAEKQLREAWLTREQIEANLDYREVLER